MSQFQEEFLEAVTKECLPSATSGRKLIFQLRFNPTQKELDHKEIATLVKAKLQQNVSQSIGTELKEILRNLMQVFESQMIEDGEDIEFLKSDERGKKGKWLRVYDWLWNKYYPRWLLEQQWQELVAKAETIEDWLQVTVKQTERDVRMPKLPPATIPLKKDVSLIVNWNGESRYLLLLNQGTSGNKYCFCPSKGFALSGELSQQKMYLPQIGAAAPSIKFEETGKEHFLGIVMEKPLDLAWLRPNNQDPVPSLDAGRLHELLEKLELQENWQLFYKSFEVV